MHYDHAAAADRKARKGTRRVQRILYNVRQIVTQTQKGILNMKLLSEFKDKKYQFFRSTDIAHTTQYFGKQVGEKKELAYFELLILDYSCDFEHDFYLRFPGQNFFTQLIGKSRFSGRGCIGSTTISNHFVDIDYRKQIEIFVQDNNMMLKFSSFEHTFLTRTLPDRLIWNMEYKELPTDLYTIMYLYKNHKIIPDYFLVASPKYGDIYKPKFMMLQAGAVAEFLILDFTRYRDGGSTNILVDIDGTDCLLYSPITWDPELKPTWCNINLLDVNEEEKAVVMKWSGLKFYEADK